MRKLSDVVAIDSKTLANIGNLISSLDVGSVMVPAESLEDAVKNIAKKEIRPLKNRVVTDYKDGIVVPVFDPAALGSIPPFVPMWMAPYDGRMVTVVDLTVRARYDKKSKDLIIYPKTLFGLMLGGSVMNRMQLQESSIMSSTKLLTALSRIYSRIFTKILDKNYAISANELFLDQLRYLTAKFFLLGVVGRPEAESVNDIASKSIGSSSKQAVQAVDQQIPAGAYTDMTSFVKAISETYKRLANVTYRSILGEVAKLYSAPAFLMLEYCPFFVVNILFAMTSSGINNEYSFESVLENDGRAVYIELARLIQ